MITTIVSVVLNFVERIRKITIVNISKGQDIELETEALSTRGQHMTNAPPGKLLR